MIKEIMEAVTIPVMAKARIGHFVECQVCLHFIFISHRHDRPERSGSIDPT
jgi:pyridoxal biosynthesis lyase PdxS